MGSNGVGVMVLDPATQCWARHDVKEEPIPGHHMGIMRATEDYVFVSYGYRRELPDLMPAVQVYAVELDRWLQLDVAGSADVPGIASETLQAVFQQWERQGKFEERDSASIGASSAAVDGLTDRPPESRQ